MNDTSPEITEKMKELFLKKTPLERLQMGGSMYDTSRYMITSAILRENPNISKAALKCEIFRRFYGNDFSAEEQEKIVRYLSR